MKTLLLLLAIAAAVIAAPPEPKFTAQDIDKSVKVGYGIAIADVDGDKLPDILLADARQIRWYKNPGKRGTEWPRYVIAEELTKNDNVCIAAQDIDGDGKCEIAIGAEWNPGDTINSGAVFYLIPPTDRTQKWEPVKFPSVEPTTHRMKWVRTGEKDWGLVVLPLHGRGNKNNQGAGAKVLLYKVPSNPNAEWKSVLLDESKHASHNFDVVRPPTHADVKIGSSEVDNQIVIAGLDGVTILHREREQWSRIQIPPHSKPLSTAGIGEVRAGYLNKHDEILATVEPMHGNQLALYFRKAGQNDIVRTVLTDKLNQGHALACADVLGTGADQIIVGWRGAKPGDSVGLAAWTALDDKGEQWRETVIDKETACEDLAVADLDGDGKLDVIAAGRASHNLRILWNDR